MTTTAPAEAAPSPRSLSERYYGLHPTYRLVLRWALILASTGVAFYPSLVSLVHTTVSGDIGGYVWMVPTMAVLVLYYGVYHWNCWFNAMIFIRERLLYPLQLVLRDILMSYQMDAMVGSAGTADVESLSESIKYATIMVATVPILLLYPFLQRYFVKGVMIGALKG